MFGICVFGDRFLVLNFGVCPFSHFPRNRHLGTNLLFSMRRWPGCCHPVGVLIKMMKVGSQEERQDTAYTARPMQSPSDVIRCNQVYMCCFILVFICFLYFYMHFYVVYMFYMFLYVLYMWCTCFICFICVCCFDAFVSPCIFTFWNLNLCPMFSLKSCDCIQDGAPKIYISWS